MKRTARIVFLPILLVGLAVGGLPVPASGGGNDIVRVRMVDGDRFRPRSVTIARGTVVKWVNRDNHDHTSTGPGWNSRLDPDETFRRTFNQVGTFSYRCMIHLTMRGTIIVQ